MAEVAGGGTYRTYGITVEYSVLSYSRSLGDKR